MTKEFYQTLEVNENATQEEIKKAYRRLAQKWHPDKNRSSEATKKMQEINKAFEILGDEEKRKRYDLGETNFTSSEYDYNYEEEMENINDELKRLNKEQKVLARKDVINIIGFEMLITGIYPRQLDNNLWAPYDKWQDKVWKIEIKDDDTKKYGIDESELDNFKETMINAIRKRKEEWKTGINNPYFDKTRMRAIETIEEEMKERGLKAEDLGEYSNYKEQINSLDRQWKVHNLKDKVLIYINSIGDNKKFEREEKIFDWRTDKQDKQDKIEIDKLKKIINQPQNDEEWKKEKEKLEKEIKRLRSENKTEELNKQNNQLKQSIQQLETENKKLREEIEELKKEDDNSPEFKSYLTKKENELQSKQSKLEQLKSIIDKGKIDNNEQKPNSFPISLVVGIGIFMVLGLLVILIISKNKKKSKY